MQEEQKKDDKKGGSLTKRGPSGLLVFLIIVITIIILIHYGTQLTDQKRSKRVPFGEFLDLVKQQKDAKQKQEQIITKIVLDGNEATAELAVSYKTVDNKEYMVVKTEFPPTYFEGPDAFKELKECLLEPKNFIYNSPNTLFRDLILPLIPWLLLFGIIWYFFIRSLRSAGGTGNIINFGRSRARFITSDKIKVAFDDVAGIEESKDEVKELVEFLKNPKKFRRLGGRIPRGMLLVGPPGCGKTLLAKAIAGEAGVPFFSICGSDFVEMFVGVGAARVRDLFKQARDNSPSIIFLDEIDAVGRRRGSGLGGGHDEREQTLNQILVEMDGFDTDQNVIMIAATNRPDILDPALLRPGRFDREVVIDLSDVRGREEILKVHAKKVKVANNVTLSVIAKTTVGSSGADLEAIINEAAILATMKGKESIEQEDLEEARDKILWGKQKKSKVMDEKEKKVTAYHEAGHALVAQLLAPVAEPVHKVTIIPRGLSLGSTMRMPEKDKYILQKSYFLANITVALAGRAAEEIFFNDISSGARDDIKRTTELVRTMVCEWGMSEKLGPIAYSDAEEHLFLGREVTKTRTHSEQTTQQIDGEVKQIISNCHERVRQLIQDNKDKLEKIAEALLKYEVLTGDDVGSIIDGKSLIPR